MLLPVACFSFTRSRLRTACARSVPDSSATCTGECATFANYIFLVLWLFML